MKLHKRSEGDTGETAPLETAKKSKKKTQESVIVYIAVLFTVAFLLILLSYFMQQHRNEDTISAITEQHTEFSTQALQNIENLQSRNLKLEDEVNSLENRIQTLEDEIADKEEVISASGEKYDALKAEVDALGESNTTLFKAKTALERLLLLQNAVLLGDMDAADEALSRMDEYKEYLDGAYTALFESLKEEIENNKIAEVENDD